MHKKGCIFMSVNGPNKNLRLNIEFQESYKKSDKLDEVGSIMAQQCSSAALSDSEALEQKGLNVQQADNNKYVYEYYENGSIKSKKLVNPDTKAVANEWAYDRNGRLLSQIINTKDGSQSIMYDDNGETHCFFEKDSDIAVSVIQYDTKKRLLLESSYNKESECIEKETSYNPETGKKTVEKIYNPKVDGQLLFLHELDEKYPQSHYENIYDKNNKLVQTNHYNKDMKLLDKTIQTENPLIKKKEYYNNEGNVSYTAEIVTGHEVNPVALALSEDFSDLNLKKIDCDNVRDVLTDYQLRADLLGNYDKMTDLEKTLLQNAAGVDTTYNPDRPKSSNTILDKIFENPDKAQRKEQIKYITDALKQKFQLVKSDSAELYCNNKEAIEKGVRYISNRLDLCAGVNLTEAKKTFEIAMNMLDNNDLFIDAANGTIDKVNYQGRTGDCWLLAGLNSIAESENGKNLIKECISVNPETQDVTVKLNGGKDEFLISQHELLKHGNLSKGDYDLRAVEIAFKRYFNSLTPPRTLDGGFAYETFEILTGNKSSIVTTINPQDPEETSLKVVEGDKFIQFNSKNAQQFKNKPLIIMAGDDALDELEKMQPNAAICADANTSEYELHQYWIRIEGQNVIVKEPHNSSNEKTYTREEFFEKFNGGLNVMVL